MLKLLIIVLLTLSLAATVFACQAPETPETQLPITPTAPTTPASPTTPTAPTTPTTPPTPTMPTTPTISTTPATPTVPTTPTENVTVPPPPAPQPALPVLASITADKTGAELWSALVRITAVFAFDTKNDSGYYRISLLSGSDNFGTKDLEWYRASKQIELTWIVPPDNQAYNRLKNNELVSSVFKTQVSYDKFVSLSTVPRTSPSDLEREIADRVNQERKLRGLALLAWDEDLYKEALQRLKAFGEEGSITPPPPAQIYQETAYVATGGVGQDAITIFQSWLVNEKYFNVLMSPNVKSFATRTDIYSNQKFYAVGLFK